MFRNKIGFGNWNLIYTKCFQLDAEIILNFKKHFWFGWVWIDFIKKRIWNMMRTLDSRSKSPLIIQTFLICYIQFIRNHQLKFWFFLPFRHDDKKKKKFYHCYFFFFISLLNLFSFDSSILDQPERTEFSFFGNFHFSFGV